MFTQESRWRFCRVSSGTVSWEPHISHIQFFKIRKKKLLMFFSLTHTDRWRCSPSLKKTSMKCPFSWNKINWLGFCTIAKLYWWDLRSLWRIRATVHSEIVRAAACLHALCLRDINSSSELSRRCLGFLKVLFFFHTLPVSIDMSIHWIIDFLSGTHPAGVISNCFLNACWISIIEQPLKK